MDYRWQIMNRRFIGALVIQLVLLMSFHVSAHSIVSTVAKVKPSVVGVGVYDPLASPRATLQGTGFVIGNGQFIATNYHVVSNELAADSNQQRIIFIGSGQRPKTLVAEVVANDPVHDLAILKVSESLTPLVLADRPPLADGSEVVFTGFPIGSILGFYPVTHSGLIAAYTPVVIPAANANQLNIEMLKRMRDPFYVYQMDATAYPGNSGSPVYDPVNGEVVAVINKVFVKTTKEAVLSDPSGITYSIPVKYLKLLLNSVK